jgi:hypothetical protein
MASRSLCTLRSRRHRRTTQHSVPAGSLRLAGQVHLPLRHFTRFRLLHASSLSVFVWRKRSKQRKRREASVNAWKQLDEHRGLLGWKTTRLQAELCEVIQPCCRREPRRCCT